ncbi:hypothetical protein FHX42_004034 [Saccharopolyspora lacisalsi]|uniref:Uncharacterized protein n=1 Tax=Halosaccharopolyspora lacisalsi TaxID=1000566 RepID=A0A839E4B7_9PSEU|nr:hypothetical protein [Halosaccharopolyspora lacisalsi]MBA8826655.1 hypothetical protein [Halosaccharopolyspora lacisalsi]
MSPQDPAAPVGPHQRAPTPPGHEPSAAPAGPPRFDLRSEFAALASVHDPHAFWDRVDRLGDRFEHEQRLREQASRPQAAADRPDSATRSGFRPVSALSGELGGDADSAPPVWPEPAAPSPGSVQRPAGHSGSLSGSLSSPGTSEAPHAEAAPSPAQPPPPTSETSPPRGVPRPPAGPPRSGPPAGDAPPSPPRHGDGPESQRTEPQPQPERPFPPPPAQSPPPAAPGASPPRGVPRPPAGQQPVPPPAQQSGPPPAQPPPGPPPAQPPHPGLPAQEQEPPSPPAGVSRPAAGPPEGAPPAGPPPPPQPPQPASQAPEPAAPQPPKYVPRPDGGFGPLGSGAWTGGGGSSYQNKVASGARHDAEEPEAGADNAADFRAARGDRWAEEEAAPQFLVDADDLYDDDYGSSRLVAPPVIGEAPPSYRDY